MILPCGHLQLHRRILLNHANFVPEKWLNMTFNQLLTLKLNKLAFIFNIVLKLFCKYMCSLRSVFPGFGIAFHIHVVNTYMINRVRYFGNSMSNIYLGRF